MVGKVVVGRLSKWLLEKFQGSCWVVVMVVVEWLSKWLLSGC